jgi:hypothetical protein
LFFSFLRNCRLTQNGSDDRGNEIYARVYYEETHFYHHWQSLEECMHTAFTPRETFFCWLLLMLIFAALGNFFNHHGDMKIFSSIYHKSQMREKCIKKFSPFMHVEF